MASVITQPRRFVGDTMACLRDLLTSCPGLETRQFVAGYCRVSSGTVRRWIKGDNVPKGMPLLYLRCFLHLADYDVKEFQQLRGNARTLALMLTLGVVTDETANQRLGYLSNPGNTNQSLLRILVRNDGYSLNLDEVIQQLETERGEQFRRTMAAVQQGIAEHIAQAKAKPTVEQPLQPVLMQVDPVMFASGFAHAIRMATVLGQELLAADRVREVRDATRGGLDIQELTRVLQQINDA